MRSIKKLIAVIFTTYIFFCLMAAYPAQGQQEGLAGYWSFDGENPWANLSALTDPVETESMALGDGRRRRAAVFSGKAYIEVPDPDGKLNFLDGVFTIEAIISPTNTYGNDLYSTSQRIVSYYDSSKGDEFRHYEFLLDKDRLAYRIGDMAHGCSKDVIVPGQWTHVAMVADGKEVTFYIDGEPSGTHPQLKMPQGGPLSLMIGCYEPRRSSFGGGIDELKIWKKAVRTFDMPALQLKQGKKVFLDDLYIGKTDNIRRVLHQPRKHDQNPVVRREQPWEKILVGSPKVLYDQGMFRMWYRSCYYLDPDIYSDRLNRGAECYAQSEDGITWEKPVLGIAEFEGSLDNNICNGGGGIYRVEHVPQNMLPVGRLVRWRGAGRYLEYSDDGLKWRRLNSKPIRLGKPFLGSISYHPAQRRYYGYGQDGFPRSVWGCYSDDLLSWSDNFPVLKASPDDPEGLEFYSMVVYVEDDLFMGLLWTYHSSHGPGNEPPNPRQYGTIDVELAVSRDGVRWQRVAPSETFIPTGKRDVDWDWGMLLTTQPVRFGDKIFFYYEGWDGDHGTKDRTAAIGVATLPRDRYLSLAAEEPDKPARVVTPILNIQANRLWVNADVSDGSLLVSVLDRHGQPVKGYSAAECRPVTTDSLKHCIEWETTSQLPSGENYLEFVLAGKVHLYAFGGYE